MKLELNADKVKVYGPKVDGGYTVSFEVGEYEKEKVAKMVLLRGDSAVHLTIEQSQSEQGGQDEGYQE